MARMWEYRDEHELAEGKRKRQEDHARFLAEAKSRKAREKREARRTSTREKFWLCGKRSHLEKTSCQMQHRSTSPSSSTGDWLSTSMSLRPNFNTINQEVEQLKQTVSALKPGKQTKKSGFQGRSAELEDRTR